MGRKSTQTGGGHIGSYQQESIFHAAWEGLHFDRTALATTKEQAVTIHHPGRLNFDQGPDFLDADIQIGRHRHHGHVELHVEADDWTRHGHHLDPHFNAVVLHVFLLQGKAEARRSDGSTIPEICLGGRVHSPPPIKARTSLACAGIGRLHLPDAPQEWLEELGERRLEAKAAEMGLKLAALGFDWSQLLWEELAGALGGPVNAAGFRQLASHVPWGLIRKYTYSAVAMEALLFGSCGVLEQRATDTYVAGLQEQWQFLQCKHGLKVRPIAFKYHRMHPAGFPTIRISQLAALAFHYRPIFQLLELGEIMRFLEKPFRSATDYWANRYDFGNAIQPRRTDLGMDTKARIAVNTLIPIAMHYSRSHSTATMMPLLLPLLQGVPPEANRITRRMAILDLVPQNALQSQGMIWLHRERCSVHRCLECKVGSKILGSHACG